MRGVKFQFAGALLMILTAAAVLSAVINFQQQSRFRLPDDGVTWVERGGAVQALHVVASGPAGTAGLRAGDKLLSINGAAVGAAGDISKVLVGLGAWSRAGYLVRRDGGEFLATVIVGEAVPDPALYYQYLVGAAYLLIGLYVYFRRGSAQKAQHFYVLCLASFVLSTFHYTGKLNDFDKLMYFGNVAAGLLAPAIFVHFCLTFPEPRSRFGRGAGITLAYLPALFLAAVFLGATSGTLQVAIPLIELRWLLDRAALAFLTGMYVAGAAVLALAQRRAPETIARQQLKWLRNGALLGIAPFAVFYVVPYLLGAVPGPGARLAVLSLLLIPVTWAWAVIRYRLMDVDVIFQQGYVYTLATLCVLGLFAGVLFSVGKFEDLGPTAAAVLILVLAFIFQPIRNWIQEQMERRFFYQDRYDYRRTLIEFARELGSETDADAMLAAVADRLMRTLSIGRLACFMRDEEGGAFRLEKVMGGLPPEASLDLSFLEPEPEKPYLFFEQTRGPLEARLREWPASVRESIAALDLTYYLPCAVHGRTIAYLGASRTQEGDFLTSDDLELLVTVSGYIGIALENARLYRSLQQKVEEFERLKEYSENIVESINVGILAVGFEDRVESWNAQMEVLTGIERAEAVGRPLSELFPAELVAQFEGLKGENGIHHIYRFRLRSERVSKVIEMPGRGANGHGQTASGAPQASAPEPPREVVLNIAVAPLVTRELSHIGRLIIFDDVTEREQLERRLVQADKLSSLGLLAAGVAHEVNTPLAVISTYAQMLAKQCWGDEQKSRLLEKIARQTFRASEIVNSLLNFSRVSPTAFDEVNLNRVIQETLGLVEHQMTESAIRVQLDLEEQLPAVRANVGRLQQVFLNLFLNARDAMESGGTLNIVSRGEGDAVRVEVTDTGHGIPAESLPRIFDPFFTTKAGRKGTGLGLSVTYGIVREHGGSIEVSSRPGEGTSFQLAFPLARKVAHA